MTNARAQGAAFSSAAQGPYHALVLGLAETFLLLGFLRRPAIPEPLGGNDSDPRKAAEPR